MASTAPTTTTTTSMAGQWNVESALFRFIVAEQQRGSHFKIVPVESPANKQQQQHEHRPPLSTLAGHLQMKGSGHLFIHPFHSSHRRRRRHHHQHGQHRRLRQTVRRCSWTWQVGLRCTGEPNWSLAMQGRLSRRLLFSFEATFWSDVNVIATCRRRRRSGRRRSRPVKRSEKLATFFRRSPRKRRRR